MRRPSSTSSSEATAAAPATPAWRRLPWAALCALLLLLAADRWALGTGSPLWPLLHDSLPRSPATALERGMVRDQLALQDLRQRPAGRPALVGVGNSRANSAFEAEAMPSALAERVTFVKLAHAGVGPFEMWTMVEELMPHQPSMVVFYLSEFDTHNPFSLVPYGVPLHLPVAATLAEHAGPGFFFRQRTHVLRMAAGRAFRAYRYRKVLAAGALSGLVSFDLGPRRRLVAQRPAPNRWVRRAWRDQPGLGMPQNLPEVAAAASAAFPEMPEAAARAQAYQVAMIGRGPDLELQEDLLWSAFERLRAAGAEVVVVEAQVHPAVDVFVDPGTKADFRRFLARAEAELGVRVLPLAREAPFPAERFRDVTHLDDAAAEVVMDRVAAEMARDLRGGAGR